MGTIAWFVAGLTGYLIVVSQTAFAVRALAQIGLPGATGAVLLGLPATFGLGIFCVGAACAGGALVIGYPGKRASDREVVTGTALSFAMGLGLFFDSMATRSSATMTNVLFGNVPAISHGQWVVFAILLALLALCVGVIYRPLLFSSVNVLVAEAKGLPVRALSVIFVVLLGLTVTMAIQAVGTLLLFALVVTPAATAAVSTVISVTSVRVGLGRPRHVQPSASVVQPCASARITAAALDASTRSRPTPVA